jgi:hypothetical protein
MNSCGHSSGALRHEDETAQAMTAKLARGRAVVGARGVTAMAVPDAARPQLPPLLLLIVLGRHASLLFRLRPAPSGEAVA